MEVEKADLAEARSDEAEIGRLTKLSLTTLGRRPYKCPEIVPAWWLLRSTHESVEGLFDTLYLVRRTRARKKSKTTRGRLSVDAQDLLRAAIVFTSAGLDACVAALLTHAVPVLATGNETARTRFERYIEAQVNAPTVNDEFRAALKDLDPRTRMVDIYIASLTKASFQRSGDLKNRARDALGITNQQLPARRLSGLDEFFLARNDVAHRGDHLDQLSADAKPLRRQRNQNKVGTMCDEALLVARDLLKAAALNIGACRSESGRR